MAVYTGAQDPTLVATYGVAFEDRFDQTSGNQYVKGNTTGSDTNWFQISEPEPSSGGIEPNTLTVSPGGTAQYTTISAAIAAVPPGSITNIKVYPGIYVENLVIPPGIGSLQLEAVIDSGENPAVSLSGTVLCQSNCVFKGPWLVTGVTTLDFDSFGVANPSFEILGVKGTYLSGTFFGSIVLNQTVLGNPTYIRISNTLLSGMSLLNTVLNPFLLFLENCTSLGDLIFDGNAGVSARGCVFSRGFASSVTIQNNAHSVLDSIVFENCFFERLILNQNAQQSRMNLCELRGLPFTGNALQITNASLFALNTLMGSTNIPLSGAPTIEMGAASNAVLVKCQIVSNTSPIDILDPSAVLILIDSIIASNGPDRAIENTPATGVGFILMAAVNFTGDTRIAPTLSGSLSTGGSMGIAAAGNDTTLTTIGYSFA